MNFFRFLETLNIQNLGFNDLFILKLDNLKYLDIDNCKNITIDENSCENIIKLYIYGNIIKPNNLLRLPKVKYLDISSNDSIIDTKSLNNLKYLKCKNENFFLKINNQKLEVLKLIQQNVLKKEITNKVFEKIISIKTLKEVRMVTGELHDDDISRIQGENASVQFLKCISHNLENKNSLCLYNLQKKFPNLNDFTLINISEIENILEIKENSDCKIKKLNITLNGNIKLYCGKYEELEIISFKNCQQNIKNIDFPIFDANCKVIFKSLKTFHYDDSQLIPDKFLNNLYNNLDKMPNLKDFELQCNPEIYSVDTKLYSKYIEKLAKMNLEHLLFKLKKGEEFNSIDELKNVYPAL